MALFQSSDLYADTCPNSKVLEGPSLGIECRVSCFLYALESCQCFLSQMFRCCYSLALVVSNVWLTLDRKNLMKMYASVIVALLVFMS